MNYKELQLQEEKSQIKSLDIFMEEVLKKKHKDGDLYNLAYTFVQKYSKKHKSLYKDRYLATPWTGKSNYTKAFHKDLQERLLAKDSELLTFPVLYAILSIEDIKMTQQDLLISVGKNVLAITGEETWKTKSSYATDLLVDLGAALLSTFEVATEGAIQIISEQLTPNSVPVVRKQITDVAFRDTAKKLSSQLISSKLLPMVCKPNPWIFQPEISLHKNYTGGYLLNGEGFKIPLCNKNLHANHEIRIDNEEAFNTINYLQEHAFKINWEVLDLWKQRYYKEGVLTSLEEKLLKLKSKRGAKALYSRMYKIMLAKLDKHLLIQYFVDTLEHLKKKFPDINSYYFPTIIDWRNRKYRCTRLNPVNNAMLRGILDTYKEEPLNFPWFKVYAFRCYFENEKLSYEESTKKI